MLFIRKAVPGILLALFAVLSCSTTMTPEDKKFLRVDPEARETFRVFMTSDVYRVSQMNHHGDIKRVHDPAGDEYIRDEIRRYDKIDETQEGVLRVWLYPDSGNIMKIRPHKIIHLREIQELLMEDIQRWSFEFPRGVVSPRKLEVRYRVTLQKKLSDEEIIKEVRKKMREEMEQID